MDEYKIIFPAIILAMFTLSCSLVNQFLPGGSPLPTPLGGSVTQPPPSERRCGDGICDGPENSNNCPIDCQSELAPGSIPPESGLEKGPDPNSFWLTNPTSEANLLVHVVYPRSWSGEELPALVLIPGGIGTINPNQAQRLVDHGFIVVYFDPDGRGGSEGVEDLGGYIQQDGLAALLQSAKYIPGIDKDEVGIVSFSYGITMASGALARYPELPAAFLIDWEGPADRQDTTVGCIPNQRVDWPDCSDDAAWAEREALNFISKIQAPYLRLQSETDHVQPDVSHAVNMVNAAVQGGVPWVRLNALLPNQTYDPQNLPVMLPEKADATLEILIGQSAFELFSGFP